MEPDHGCYADRESDIDFDAHSSHNEAMSNPVHPVIRRYADGEISAMQAASELGKQATVADVIVMLRQAGLKPPEPTPERARAELAHARHVLGWDQQA